MKSKGILAMALVGVLSVSAIAPSALAATSSVVNKEETSAQETVERHGKREKHEKVAEPENSIGKDAAKEVTAGRECGMSIAGYNDIKEGDVIEAFHIVEIKRTL